MYHGRMTCLARHEVAAEERHFGGFIAGYDRFYKLGGVDVA